MTFPSVSPPPGCPAHQPAPDIPHAEPVPDNALYGPQFTTDPASVYARLRQKHGPVSPVVLEAGVHAWLVLGYREVTAVLRDRTRYASHPRHWQDLADRRVPPTWPLLPVAIPRPNARFTDDEDTPDPTGAVHTRLRGAINHALGQINPRRLRRSAERAADQLIGTFAPNGTDLISDYAARLPAMVMADQLGLPPQDVPTLLRLVGTVLEGAAQAASANSELEQLLYGLVAARRTRPGNDLVSSILAAPQHLDDDEAMHQTWLTLLAGLEMCQGWIGNTLRMVLTSNLQAQLTGARLTIPAALSRTLWEYSPVQCFIGRYTRAPVQLGRYTIPAGQLLVIGLAAAAADPVLHTGTGPLADNRAYPVFGTGPHACPAEDIAETITATAVERVLHHLHGLRLAVPPDALTWRPSLTLRSLAGLPVTYTSTHRLTA